MRGKKGQQTQVGLVMLIGGLIALVVGFYLTYKFRDGSYFIPFVIVATLGAVSVAESRHH